jgi:hypothetical protein
LAEPEPPGLQLALVPRGQAEQKLVQVPLERPELPAVLGQPERVVLQGWAQQQLWESWQGQPLLERLH